MEVRPAEPGEAEALSELAFASKAIWGYDTAFLERARVDLAIEAASIVDRGRYRVGVAAESGRAGFAGFYALHRDGAACELERLFVAPDRIGAGVGRLLWDVARRDAAAWGFTRVRVASDPNAVGFYERCGAVRAGTIASAVDATRRLPLLYLAV